MIIMLAMIAGLGLGYIIERGDLCFHSTLRGLVRHPRQLDLFRAYLLALLVATPLVWILIVLGWIDPWIPPLAWPANIAGGLIFGIGMVVAATCITGLFYKLGHGMLGTLVALVTWAGGDIITYRGPLLPLRELLNSSQITVHGQSATALNLFGSVGGGLLVAGLWIAGAIWLVRSPRADRGNHWNWGKLGLAVGVFTGLAWLLARAGGSNYTFGTSGVPTNLFLAVTGGEGGSLWITVALVSLIPGAFLAAWLSGTLWVRGESSRRYLELAAGGFLMGIGAAMSGGCNLGHSLVGVPLLSMGSITTTLAMLAGVWLADRTVRWLAAKRSKQVAAESFG